MNKVAILALLTAGLGWGTTGLFVRALSGEGLSAYQLLILRLVIAGSIVLPVFLATIRRESRRVDWRQTLKVGGAMVFYYLGAITAFQNLQLVVAALIIGSSPVMAWIFPLIVEKRGPRKSERREGLGVATALCGLLLLITARATSNVSLHSVNEPLGLLGATVAALVTVLNARFLKRLGSAAPRPLEITLATVAVGILISPFFLGQFSDGIRRIVAVIELRPWLCLGFGVFATAIPGLAITYASARLEPQATATVSIQLQVWSGVLAWIALGEAMSPLQIVAACLVIAGSWMSLGTHRTAK